MLEWRLGGVRCRLSLLFPALVTALLLWQPDGLAVTCLLASLIHEGGHLLAMLSVGVPPQRCTLGAFGMRIDLKHNLTVLHYSDYMKPWFPRGQRPVFSELWWRVARETDLYKGQE